MERVFRIERFVTEFSNLFYLVEHDRPTKWAVKCLLTNLHHPLKGSPGKFWKFNIPRMNLKQSRGVWELNFTLYCLSKKYGQWCVNSVNSLKDWILLYSKILSTKFLYLCWWLASSTKVSAKNQKWFVINNSESPQ